MKLPCRRFLHLAAGAAALPAVSRIARAQAYPSRPVRIIRARASLRSRHQGPSIMGFEDEVEPCPAAQAGCTGVVLDEPRSSVIVSLFVSAPSGSRNLL